MSEYLYIHIPFCVRKCVYCDFLSVCHDEAVAREYIDALCRELALKKGFAGELKSIYIGGGTPSLLPNDCFTQLFKCLRDGFKFSASPEITVEANPGTMDESKINALLLLGVNRLSIGVQSFNDNELKTLGRIHTSEEAARAIGAIKKAGLKNFSIDLMYGIPGQTMDSWKETLSRATWFSPNHISSYELTPEKGTPLYEMVKSEESNPPLPPFTKGGMGGLLKKIKMPDEELVLDMFGYAIDYLSSKGYEHYEISNFALPGFRCIHNMNYWDRGEYIGAGAGAHSFIRSLRSKNAGDIKKYIEITGSGNIPEIESIKLAPSDEIKEFIFLGLRKTEGISILKAKELGIAFPGACKELIDEGYLEITEGLLRLTRKGLPLSNMVIVKIFENLEL
ncbi:MAG: radical SAM family heme chaperone HemW [Nitrospirae bacterium]|nr:MAG: radical SAM family heme chaperone HemW [Nitrospirota bacterium]